ncbi:hypothetical protein GOL39_28655 [Sinorhizobium medicae]|nr:hypothetical protein [Sinorhizobium medicae]MDX1146537.1 hypothetical protein [Sinorhizobium medicae]
MHFSMRDPASPRRGKLKLRFFSPLLALVQLVAFDLGFALAQEHQTGLLFLDEGSYRSIPLASTPLMGGLPTSVDMSASFPAPGNQGQQGSCVGWAVAYAMKSAQERIERSWDLSDDQHLFSPAFIYNQIKSSSDCKGGTYIEDALNLVRAKGAASIADFPYYTDSCDHKPSSFVEQSARPFNIADWRRVNALDITEVKTQIAAGFPVVIGIIVDDSFQRLGYNQIYEAPDNVNPGGHAMVIVGYDDANNAFKVINSWGTNWGTDGYGWIDYQTFVRMQPRGYVSQDVIVKPPTPTPSFDGTRVVYFTKESDRGVINKVLQDLGIDYEDPEGTSNVPTSLLTCTPDIPGESLKALALALYDSGVRLKRVNFALRSLRVSNRISLESTERSNTLHPLTREDLQGIDKCKFIKSAVDPN